MCPMMCFNHYIGYDLYYEVIHGICFMFLCNQEFYFGLLVFSTHAFIFCLVFQEFTCRFIQSCCLLLQLIDNS